MSQDKDKDRQPDAEDESSVPYIRDLDAETQGLFRAALARSEKCTIVVDDSVEDYL